MNVLYRHAFYYYKLLIIAYNTTAISNDKAIKAIKPI
jgi:hypothetical protein